MKENENHNKNQNEFIREIINHKATRDWNFILRFIIIMLAGGVILGVAASATIIHLVPYMSNRNAKVTKDVIIIPQDDSGKKPKKGNTDDIKDYKELNEQLNKVADNAEKSIVAVVGVENAKSWPEAQEMVTSGIILSNQNEMIVITDYETIANADSIEVIVYGGEKLNATLKQKDRITGLCALTVDTCKLDKKTADKLTPAKLGNSNNIVLGENVIVIGNPYGKETYVSFGNITSTSNPLNIVDGQYHLLTTDVSTTENMNGFVINLDGEIIGIELNSLRQESMEGILSALLISDVKSSMQQIANGIEPAYLGIEGEDITDDVNEKFNSDMPYGVYVKDAVQGSPAYASGIMSGDIIVRINDKNILSMADLKLVLDDCKAGQEIHVEVMRYGKNEYKSIEYTIVV